MDHVSLIHCTPEADNLIERIARVSNPKNQEKMDRGELKPSRLIRYLAEHKHWSPFEMASACLEFNTTRAISAQLIRHRSFSFQEFSQRYAETTGNAFPEMRRSGTTNRQSSTYDRDLIHDTNSTVLSALESAEKAYKDLLEAGVAPECARMVLPMCAKTRIYVHGTIRSWHHYFEQRCSEHAQKEHRLLAEEARVLLSAEMPVTAEALGWLL